MFPGPSDPSVFTSPNNLCADHVASPSIEKPTFNQIHIKYENNTSSTRQISCNSKRYPARKPQRRSRGSCLRGHNYNAQRGASFCWGSRSAPDRGTVVSRGIDFSFRDRRRSFPRSTHNRNPRTVGQTLYVVETGHLANTRKNVENHCSLDGRKGSQTVSITIR